MQWSGPVSYTHLDERMTYTSVALILDGDEKERKRYEKLVPMFEQMKELSDILREVRHERGSVDFDFPESKIVLNEDGKAIDVIPAQRNKATKIIEDFMLLANETVAENFYWQEIPFVYRTQDVYKRQPWSLTGHCQSCRKRIGHSAVSVFRLSLIHI